ncbi:MAG: hypothetical protein IPM54_12585 [Polyangiaceae bacterium]|nr:hypothetical protein [Polyangiaceae bacterium]
MRFGNIFLALGCISLVVTGCAADIDESISGDEAVALSAVGDESTGVAEGALSTYTVINAVTPFFVPPHVRGDREFKGHGPVVDSEIKLEIFNQRELWARVYMRAIESERDWTEARGHQYYRLHTASTPIVSILGPTSFTHRYIDSDHGTDSFSFSPSSLVKRLDYVGDTRGDEAGTRTGVRVYFNPIRLQLQ